MVLIQHQNLHKYFFCMKDPFHPFTCEKDRFNLQVTPQNVLRLWQTADENHQLVVIYLFVSARFPNQQRFDTTLTFMHS